jgi:hypothetical protein
MRAITISDGTGEKVRFNADQVLYVTPAKEPEGDCIHVYLAECEEDSVPFTVVLVGEGATAFLEWWDGEARRGGGYIGGNDPQTATNDGTDWVPSVNERVSLVAHDPFAAPEEYMGVVVHHGSFGGTLVVRVAWDNGKESDLPYRALRKAD